MTVYLGLSLSNVT